MPWPLTRQNTPPVVKGKSSMNGVAKLRHGSGVEGSLQQDSQDLKDIKVVKLYNGLDFFYDNGKRRQFSPPEVSVSKHEPVTNQRQPGDTVSSYTIQCIGQHQ